MTVLYTDIGELVTNDPAQRRRRPAGHHRGRGAGRRRRAIAWVGRRADAPDADERVDCADASVIPGFVDSHAHLVFAGERSAEFAARMSGQPYAAGGIATTVAATRAADDATLLAASPAARRRAASRRVSPLSRCKSGYGLTVDDEARSLRIAGAVTDETTFLGAHVVPAEFRDDRAAYVDLVTGPMLQACAPHARWIDVFCDRGAFDVDEARHILSSGMAAGLHPAAARRPTRPRARASGSRSSSARHRWITAPTPPTTTSTRSRRCRHHRRHAAARRRILHARTVSRRETAHRRRRHGRAGDRLQPRQFVHHEHAVLHRRRGARHEFHSGRGIVGGHRGRCRGAAPRRRRGPRRRAASRLRPARRTRRTCTWPTGPACRWCATSCRAGQHLPHSYNKVESRS